MPALVANYQKQVTVTKLKKGVSVLAQAYAMAADEGTPPERVWNNADYAKKVGCAGLIQNDGWEIKDDYPW
jgi:hypothetical protein